MPRCEGQTNSRPEAYVVPKGRAVGPFAERQEKKEGTLPKKRNVRVRYVGHGNLTGAIGWTVKGKQPRDARRLTYVNIRLSLGSRPLVNFFLREWSNGLIPPHAFLSWVRIHRKTTSSEKKPRYLVSHC